MSQGRSFKLTSVYFFPAIFLLCIAYLIFEYYFIPYSVLAADEFVFARHIYEYTFNIPYRDFSPYKTVLGYYLLSLPMFFSHSLLQPLFYIKDEIAIINTLFIIITCYLAGTIFDKRAVLITLFAIIANQLFLVYATDLRVDMLTSWLCLLSALLILKNQFKLAGYTLGIAFLVSQKALWYALAINGGMLICWYTYRSSLYSIRNFIHFNIATSLPIFAYILIWCLIASPSVIFYNLFYEAYIQAGIDWYVPIYMICWNAILRHGPILFLLWPATLISLTEKNSDDLSVNRLFIISFGFIALLQFVSYKQAFPYNFVFTIPAFFLLYSDFFTWMFRSKPSSLFSKPSFTLFLSFTLYATMIGVVISSLSVYLYRLSSMYYLSMLFPFALYGLCYFKSHRNRFYSLIFAFFLGLFIWLGILYPLSNEIKSSFVLNGKYQQHIIELTAQLLKKDDRYVAGIPFLYQIDQPIDGMKNLIGPEIEYLTQPSDKLKSLLLPSLYLAPSNPTQVIADFERTPVKLILCNYRTMTLPPTIIDYINHHYQHFYGSIYLYAPLISTSQLTFEIQFAGNYRVQAKKSARILIDNKRVHAGSLINLKKGDHVSFANHDYRLALIPDIDPKNLIADHAKNDWVKMIKAIIA